MAEAEKQIMRSKRRGIAKSKEAQKPRNKPVARARKASATKAEATGAGKGTKLNVGVGSKVDATVRLRKAMNREVAVRADAIANGLTEQAALGSSTCARFIWEVMKGEKQTGKASSKRVSRYIGLLESEQERVNPEAGRSDVVNPAANNTQQTGSK